MIPLHVHILLLYYNYDSTKRILGCATVSRKEHAIVQTRELSYHCLLLVCMVIMCSIIVVNRCIKHDTLHVNVRYCIIIMIAPNKFLAV